MKNKLLVITDLGNFRAYKFDEESIHSHPPLELVQAFETTGAHARISDMVTDQAGQFSKGSLSFSSISDMSNGERNHMLLEKRRRLIKQMADNLHDLLKKKDFETCYFAAGSEINRQILAELPPQMRGKIEKNVSINLTRVPKSELLDRFASNAPPQMA